MGSISSWSVLFVTREQWAEGSGTRGELMDKHGDS